MMAKDTSGKYQYKVSGPVKKNSKAENLKKINIILTEGKGILMALMYISLQFYQN